MSLYKRNGIWHVYITRPDGTRIRRTSGTSDKKAAQEYHDKLKYELWAEQKLDKKPKHTWDEAALKWLKEKGDKKSIDTDICILRWLTQNLRGMYLDEITRPVIMELAEKKKAESSPSRANRCLALLRSILNRAVRVWEWLDKTPAVTLYSEPKVRVRYLTTTQIHILTNELPDHLKPVFLFSIMTGLRRSNILKLRWDQVDFNRRMIIIDGSEMKAGQTHVVPITQSVVELLSSQLGKHNIYVFTYNGEPIRWFDKSWKSALKRAGIEDYRWHDNRHTWASLLIQNGVPLHEVQEMGGWHSIQMVQRYAHLSPSKLAQNAELLERKIGVYATFTPHPKLQ